VTFPTGNTGNSNEPWWALFISREGVAVALSIFLVWWLTSSVITKMSEMQMEHQLMRSDIGQHIQSTTFYQHQLCVMAAKQGGEPEALCEPPK